MRPLLLPVGGSGSVFFPYYSSRGSIDRPPGADDRGVRVAIISQHGAERNADDYLCAALAATGRQNRFPASQVVVVAPRFMTLADGPPTG